MHIIPVRPANKRQRIVVDWRPPCRDGCSNLRQRFVSHCKASVHVGEAPRLRVVGVRLEGIRVRGREGCHGGAGGCCPLVTFLERVVTVQIVSGSTVIVKTPSVTTADPLLTNCSASLEHQRCTSFVAARAPFSLNDAACGLVVLTSALHFPCMPQLPCNVSTIIVNVGAGYTPAATSEATGTSVT